MMHHCVWLGLLPQSKKGVGSNLPCVWSSDVFPVLRWVLCGYGYLLAGEPKLAL